MLNKGPVAQRLEQYTHNVLVPGSNPGGPTNLTKKHNNNSYIPQHNTLKNPNINPHKKIQNYI